MPASRWERISRAAGVVAGGDWEARLAGYAGAGLGSWPELAGWTTVTFRALLGDVGDETRLPEREARAADTVARVVSGLAELGAVETVADLTALRLTLGLELADDLPRQGRFGTGVLVAPLGSAIGLDADVVFAVGLAEELVPGRLREDALLPERVRALAPGQLAPLRDRLYRQHRQQRMHQEAEQLQSGARWAAPTLAEVLGRRGVQL